jgi:hypothetical protein
MEIFFSILCSEPNSISDTLICLQRKSMVGKRILVKRASWNNEKGIYPICSRGEEWRHILKCGGKSILQGRDFDQEIQEYRCRNRY